MAWYVKRRHPDGTISTILCNHRAEVVRNFYDQENQGGEVWIEDTGGQQSEGEVPKADTTVRTTDL